MSATQRLRAYYVLSKPGIVRGNTIAGVAGYLFASGASAHIITLLGLMSGMALVIGSSCVINNYIDRDIDRHMQRTQKRALVTGEISSRQAITFAVVLAAVGFMVLLLTTTWLTALLGLIGVVLYVAVYGYAKRKSKWGTLVGSMSGAIPPVAGYTAGGASLDTAALLLFLVLTAWQMPHFYAIAMFRSKEYAAAHIPVWPLVKGMASTKLQILVFTILFIAASLLLPIFGYAGIVYTVLMAAVGLWWLWYVLKGPKAVDDVRWARQIFGQSLLVLLVFCAAISVNAFLP